MSQAQVTDVVDLDADMWHGIWSGSGPCKKRSPVALTSIVRRATQSQFCATAKS